METLRWLSDAALSVNPVLMLVLGGMLLREGKRKESIGLLIGAILAAFGAASRFGWLG